MTTTATELYASDFDLWAQAQIEALRLGRYDQLDATHIIEELQLLAGRDRREIFKRLCTMMEHLIKIHMYPESYSLRQWKQTVRRSARNITILLQTSPSLKHTLTDDLYAKAFSDAQDDAHIGTGTRVPDSDFSHFVGLVKGQLEAMQ